MKTSDRVRLYMIVVLVLGLFGSPDGSRAQTPSEREVVFRNGPVELRGTITVPGTGGRHPAIVFLHGSGPVTREGASQYAQEYARLGFASLRFDKRGSGASGGSWITSSLDDLAGDALAAIAYLKTREDVLPDKIGFWGVSQAGWVATLAASRSVDVGFMIVISGGGVSPRESELYSYEKEFEKAGLSAEERSEASGLLDLYFGYLSTGEGRSTLVERLSVTREDRLTPLRKQLNEILPSAENRKNWSWVATWDPSSDISKIHCPVLLMLGDRDTDHPTPEALRKWREGLRAAENTDLTAMVFPGAGHGIRMREGHTGPGRPPFADGYSEVMAGWLWRHVIQKP